MMPPALKGRKVVKKSGWGVRPKKYGLRIFFPVELNYYYLDYKSSALPIMSFVVLGSRLELPLPRLQIECFTIKLTQLNK